MPAWTVCLFVYGRECADKHGAKIKTVLYKCNDDDFSDVFNLLNVEATISFLLKCSSFFMYIYIKIYSQSGCSSSENDICFPFNFLVCQAK